MKTILIILLFLMMGCTNVSDHERIVILENQVNRLAQSTLDLSEADNKVIANLIETIKTMNQTDIELIKKYGELDKTLAWTIKNMQLK